MPDALSFSAAPPAGALAVDLDRLLAGHLFVQGASGSGKSHLLRQLLEETHGRVRHVVVDPEGEYHTLRERHAYVVLGQDLAVTAETAGPVARRLAEAGASVVLDLSETEVDDRDAVTAAFLRATFDAAGTDAGRGHALVVVDEAHDVAPEAERTGSRRALVTVAKRGRKRGLGLVVATQRIADVANAVVSQCSNRAVGRTSLGADLRRSAAELGWTTKQGAALKGLAPGEFYVYGPAFGGGEVVAAVGGPVATTHPEPGRLAPPATAAPDELAELLAGISAEVEADTDAVPADAVPAEIARLNRQVRRLTGEVDAARAERDAARDDLRGFAREVRLTADGFRADGERLAKSMALWAEEAARVQGDAAAPAPTTTNAPEPEDRPEIAPEAAPGAPLTQSCEPDSAGLDALPDARRRVLDALASMEAVGLADLDRRNLAVFSGQSPKSSAYGEHVSALKAAGLVGYPGPGRVALTGPGRALADSGGAPRSLDELHGRWLGYLDGQPASVLRVLVAEREVSPSDPSLSREHLAEDAGYSARSSAFGEAVSLLKSLGLVVYPRPGRVEASDLLFPAGLD